MAVHPKKYAIDNSGFLFLSQMERNHSNVYRFCARLAEPVSPELLQKAADRIFTRFPTIYARFRPGFFHYSMEPLKQAPRVCADPGILRTMSSRELKDCAYRIYYRDCEISIEAFHSLTDGYGAIVSLRTLIAEYLHLKYGLDSPERQQMLCSGAVDWDAELRDAYLDYGREKPWRPANRHSYQLTPQNRDWNPKIHCQDFSTSALLAAARHHGVSMTILLSGIMAEVIMEQQGRQAARKKKQPVRIMIPIDLRRQFPSKTLRNFVLYALPTLEWEEKDLPLGERLVRFREQFRQQAERSVLAGQISANVRIQGRWWFRSIPLAVKCSLMKIGYRFFGERNSSITVTNLGPVAFSDTLNPHILGISVHLTPRRGSPYNCAIISSGETTSISISRFSAEQELEEMFFHRLRTLVEA